MRFGTRELIFLALLAAVPTVAYAWPWETPCYGLRTWKQRITQQREQARRKQQKLGRLGRVTDSVEDLDQQIRKLSKALDSFKQRLPAHREVETVVRQVWKLAEDRGLNPRSVRIDEVSSSKRYARVPIRLEIVGDFKGFYSFLLELENLPRITRTPTLKLQKKAERKREDAAGPMQAEMLLSVFFEPEDDPANPSMKGATAP